MAYIPQDDEVWFVKLSGPTAFVDPLEDDYRAILESLSFDDDGEPKVKLPEGWTKKPAKSMRFATYVKGGPMEVAVTRLAATDPEDATYVALNVNRWLRELGQPPRDGNWREEAEKRSELSTITIAGQDAWLFDIRGNILPARTAAIFPADPHLDYTAPEGWESKPADAFRMAIFTVPGDVEVSISQAGGNPVDNINRWEGQLGVEPSSDADLRQKMEAVTVDEQPGLLIRIDGERKTGESEDAVPSSTVGVITTDGEKQYFIKMIGPTEGVDAAEDDFRQFLTTIEF